MKEQILSQTYARALMELGKKKGESVVDGLKYILGLIENHGGLKDIFFLDVFTQEEKLAVFARIAEGSSLNKTVKSFIKFLLLEKRILHLFEIYKEVLVLDDRNKGLMRGKISGSERRPEENLVKGLTETIEKKLGSNIELVYHQSDDIVAGYRVMVEDMMIDATLDYQLHKFKASVLSV